MSHFRSRVRVLIPQVCEQSAQEPQAPQSPSTERTIHSTTLHYQRTTHSTTSHYQRTTHITTSHYQRTTHSTATHYQRTTHSTTSHYQRTTHSTTSHYQRTRVSLNTITYIKLQVYLKIIKHISYISMPVVVRMFGFVRIIKLYKHKKKSYISLKCLQKIFTYLSHTVNSISYTLF